MRSCSARKSCSALASEAVLRETVMSTIEPDSMSGGRRIEGNSIYVAQGCHGLSAVLSLFMMQSSSPQAVSEFLLDCPGALVGHPHDKAVCN